MAYNEERIVVTVDGKDNLSGKFKRLSTVTEKFGRRFKTLTTVSNKYNAAGIKIGQSVKRIKKPMDDLSKSYRANTNAALGVMFFSRQLSIAIGALFTPAAQAFGVFELWSDMLLLLFLPTMEAIFPLFVQFVEYMMNLPDPVKQMIGGFLGLVGAIAAIVAPLIGAGLAITGLERIAETLGRFSNFSLSGDFKSLFQAGGFLEKVQNIARNTVGVIAIGYSLVAAATAYDEFKKGKMFNSFMDALSAAFIGVGGITLLLGNAPLGGALILIGVGFKLLGEGIFFTTLFTFIGTMVGLMQGAGVAMSLAFLSGLTSTIKSGLNIIASFLESNPLTRSLGKEFRGIAASDLLKSSSSGEIYAQLVNTAAGTMVSMRDLGKNLDKDIATAVNTAEQNRNARNEGTASFPNSTGGVAIPGLASFPPGIVINQYNNITVSDQAKMASMIAENNRTLVSDIRRYVST